ncbi:hypothetical protein CBER1_09889 [Cercospora berteroae]|uniref:Cutinase n=1 Tax=Cercospora berteroae TaxID=357750 RepID=A0A2S6CJQ7_9PEZI|nr:hypothetical protein CBER1_09889 [Cercospora berteroae]
MVRATIYLSAALAAIAQALPTASDAHNIVEAGFSPVDTAPFAPAPISEEDLTPITSATELTAEDVLAGFAVSKRQSSCASGVYMIVARGSGEPQGPGRLSQVVQLIGQKILGSVFTSVVYPANIIDFGAPAYPFSVREGIQEVQRLIEARVNQCPKERIVLLGYSQGANACSTGLAGSGFGNPPLKENLRGNIRGVALFGDPTQAPNQSYSRGSATDGEGILGRTDFSLPELSRYSSRLLQWCDRGDRVCAEDIEPYDGAVHSNVVSKYANAAANHIANVATR